MDTSYTELYKRFKKAQDNRDQWRSIHKEACEYCLPNRDTFDLHAQGDDKTARIFDSTAVHGLKTFANKVQASVMPAWSNWADLVAGDDIPDDYKDAIDAGLEDATKKVFSAINHSNFTQELSPSLQDLGIGTGCLTVEHGTMGQKLKFSCIPLSQLYPEKPLNGVLESVWQKFKMPPSHIKATWPIAKLGEKVSKMAEKPNADDVEVLNGQIFDPVKGVYHHIVMTPVDKKVIVDSVYKYKRFIPFRWSVTPGETFGRGIAIDSLSDVKTLNKMVEQYLAGAAFSINPMMTAVSDGIFNPHTVRMQPGGIVPVGSNLSSNPTLSPLQVGNNINHGSMVIAEMQATINKAFFANPLGDVTDSVKSATEQMLRTQEMLRSSGASFGRLNSELVSPLLNSIISILIENGDVPEMQADGKLVKIRHQSPLAKAEQMEAFQTTQVWLETNMGVLGEQANMYIKMEDIPGVTGEQLGVTTKLIRSDEERAALAEQAQAQQQAAVQQGQANV